MQEKLALKQSLEVKGSEHTSHTPSDQSCC